MKTSAMVSASVIFSTLLLANTASAQLPMPSHSSDYQTNSEYVSCAPSTSEKDCLIETAKRVIQTGKEILLGQNLINLVKALAILKKFGINL